MIVSTLVSVIIPCFNAERWLSEAIESCLNQTYPNLEIIVIDDGSTDRSLEIIQSYGDRIIWEHTHHQGGNHARNRGFALSRGQFIQYLDADDYILPSKIETQVKLLEKTGTDIAYGDWRFQNHLPDGRIVFEEGRYCGEQPHVLRGLLSDSWWVAVSALLYRREAIEKGNGWDETLWATQDRDFFLEAVLNGAKAVYQPGFYSIYRCYIGQRVSTASRLRWLRSHCQVNQKAEQKLIQLNQWSQENRDALARCYFTVAREMIHFDFPEYLKLVEKISELSPGFDFDSRKTGYKMAQKLLGYTNAEKLAGLVFLLQAKVGLNEVKPITGILQSKSA